MFDYSLPAEINIKIPFPLQVKEWLYFDINKGFISCRNQLMLFPNGRLKVKEGFKWDRPAGIYIQHRKFVKPCLVHYALGMFMDDGLLEGLEWKIARKTTLITMAKLAQMNWFDVLKLKTMVKV